jgi:hypothetical protein
VAILQRRWLSASHDDLRPADRVTVSEAAVILGVEIQQAESLLSGLDEEADPRLTRGVVEEVAAQTYDWLAHRHDPAAYWVSGQRAAETLGLTRTELDQLTTSERLPCLLHHDGILLYRRQQLLNTRRLRAARGWRRPYK